MTDTVRSRAEILAEFGDEYAGFNAQQIRDLVVSSFPAFEDVTITHAQLVALRATPKALVAAPGANLAIVTDQIHVVKLVGTAYTETADNLVLEYADGTDVLTIETTGFLDQATVQSREYGRPTTEYTPVANSGLQLKNSGDGELGAGANGIKVRVYYHTVNLT